LFAFASMFSGRRPWVRMPPLSYIALTAASSSNGSLARGSLAVLTSSGKRPIDSYHDALRTS
jgi:hypothetical protein